MLNLKNGTLFNTPTVLFSSLTHACVKLAHQMRRKQHTSFLCVDTVIVHVHVHCTVRWGGDCFSVNVRSISTHYSQEVDLV